MKLLDFFKRPAIFVADLACTLAEFQLGYSDMAGPLTGHPNSASLFVWL